MIIKINDSFEFVLTKVPDSDRRVMVVREIGNPSSEICMDMTKQQAATLADAIQALSR